MHFLGVKLSASLKAAFNRCLVRSLLEYLSLFWGSYTKSDSFELEKILIQFFIFNTYILHINPPPPLSRILPGPVQTSDYSISR